MPSNLHSDSEKTAQVARDQSDLSKAIGLFAALADTRDWFSLEWCLAEIDDWLRPSFAKALAAFLQKHSPATWVASAHVLNRFVQAPAPHDDKGICYLAKSADADKKTRWLTRHVSHYAGDLVAWMYCGVGTRDEAAAELWAAAEGAAAREGWPVHIGTAAAEGAWRWADERFRKFHGALRGRIWPLGKVRAPGEQIMADAVDVNMQARWVLPTPLLEEAASQIAHAAASPRRKRRG